MRRSLKSTPTWRPTLLIAFHLHNPPVVTWGAVKGAPEPGAFILTLDSSPRHLQSSWERSATQFSWASFLSRFGFSSYWHAFRNASELSAAIIPVRSQKYVDRRFVPLRFSKSCLQPPLLPGFYPHSQGATLGPVHVYLYTVRSRDRQGPS